MLEMLKRWMLQPVRLCKNGCMPARVAPAFNYKKDTKKYV